jgi:hypothetical protein
MTCVSQEAACVDIAGVAISSDDIVASNENLVKNEVALSLKACFAVGVASAESETIDEDEAGDSAKRSSTARIRYERGQRENIMMKL